MGYRGDQPDAPPHDEADRMEAASRHSGDAADERAHRSRLAATGVYRTEGDTGHSDRISVKRAIEPLVLNPGARGAMHPRGFKPMKT